MKVNKIFLVSLILLTILTLGAASAADDIAADNLAVEDAGDLELEVPVNDEITTDGDNLEDVAVSDSNDKILSASQDEKLSNASVIVVNQDNYMDYFNQTDGGKFVDSVEPGTTLDIQGSIVSLNSSNKISIDINKPVNIISTTGDGLIELNTTDRSALGSCPANSFIISNGGSYSNITGITFHNTQMWIANTTQVVLDNISVIIEQAIGSGVGSTSIRENTTFLTLKNSYFYTKSNGNAAAFTLSWADNCTIDNNTFIMGQGVATICFSYNAANIPGVNAGNMAKINSYNNFTNNYIADENGKSLRVQSQRCGMFDLFENNTFVKCDVSFSASNGNIFIGNKIVDSGNLASGKAALVYDNLINGTLNVGTESTAYNNTALGVMTVGATSEVYNNSVAGMTLGGADILVHDNVIDGATTINAATNSQIYDNTFLGDYIISFNNANAKNITFANNDVIGNIQFGNKNAKNNKIINNTITTSSVYAIDLKTFTDTENNISGNILYSKDKLGNDAVNHAEDSTLILDNYPSVNAAINVSVNDIKVGETAVVNVTANETSLASADIYVNGEKYSINLSKGKGSLELKDLLSGNYDVSVISTDKTYGAQNSTSFEVTKNLCPILVDAPAKTQWIDSNITVTIADATGTVTLAINGSEFTEELEDGVAIFSVPDFAYGNYDFNVTYSGDYKYFENETNGTLTVNRNKEVKIIASDIVAYKLVDKFVAKFINYIDEGIANVNVTIAIDDATYPLVTDENGTAVAELALTRGKYDVNVEFKEIPDEYDAASAKYDITVIDASIIKIMSVSEEGLITASLYDALGAPIANATVTATMNGTGVNLTTNDTGLFEFQAENGCEVIFEFAGDDITTASEASITVNIKPTPKDTSIINIVSVEGTGLITGSLTSLGNPIANAIVVATMNRTSVNLVTDDSGLFQFKAINALEVLFNYAGDLNTTDANASIILNNVAPVVKDVSVIGVVAVDGTGLVTGSLSVDGKPVVNVTVVASVGGVDTNLTTDVAGLFVFQAVNGQEVVFKYDGNDTVDSSVASFVLSNVAPVVKAVPVINIVAVDSTGLITGSLTLLGNPIADATVSYIINNNVTGNTTADANGNFQVQSEFNSVMELIFAGNETVDAVNTTIALKDMTPAKLASSFNVTEGISIKTYAVDSKAGEVGQTTSFRLTDSNGNPIANATVKFAYKTVILNRTTDENGIVFIGINTQIAQEALCAMSYLGDEKHNATFVAFNFDIQKKPIKISAAVKTYKANQKTKKYTVTLKTEKCNSRDGKVYISAGKKVTLKLNGKTYTAKTDKNGKVTFSLKITKKGKQTAKISFAGDKTYKSASKSVKITIK